MAPRLTGWLSGCAGPGWAVWLLDIGCLGVCLGSWSMTEARVNGAIVVGWTVGRTWIQPTLLWRSERASEQPQGSANAFERCYHAMSNILFRVRNNGQPEEQILVFTNL